MPLPANLASSQQLLFAAADPSDSLPHIPSSLTALYSVSTLRRDQGTLLPVHATLPSYCSCGHSRSVLQSSSLLKSQAGERGKASLPSVPQFTSKVPDHVYFIIFLLPLTPLLHPLPLTPPPDLSGQDGTYLFPLSHVLLFPSFHCLRLYFPNEIFFF